MEEAALRVLLEQAQATQATLVKWVIGLGSLAVAAIVGLFGYLLKAKAETNAAYKEVAPIASASLRTAEALEKLLLKAEAEKREVAAARETMAKNIARVEEVAKRMEERERR